MVKRFYFNTERVGWIWMATFAAAVWFLAGCGTKPVMMPANDSPDLFAHIKDAVDNQYPDRFKTRHRAILTLLGKDYVMNGFLSVNRTEKKVDLVAQDDLGGTVFDIRVGEGKPAQIQSAIKTLKSKWLEKTLVRDLKSLYLQSVSDGDHIFFEPSGKIVLSRMKDDMIEQLVFKAKENEKNRLRLEQVRHLKAGKTVYAIDLTTKSKQPGAYPEMIRISDLRMRYHIKIAAQYFTAPDNNNDGSGSRAAD